MNNLKRITICLFIIFSIICLPINAYGQDLGNGMYLVDVTEANLTIEVPKSFQYTLLDSSSKSKFYNFHEEYNRNELIAELRSTNSYLFGLNKEESMSIELQKFSADEDFACDFALLSSEELEQAADFCGESLSNSREGKMTRQEILYDNSYIILKYIIKEDDYYSLHYVTVVDGDYIILTYYFANASLVNQNEKMLDASAVSLYVKGYSLETDKDDESTSVPSIPTTGFWARVQYGETSDFLIWVIIALLWTISGAVASWILIMPLCIIFTSIPLTRFLSKNRVIDKERADRYSYGWISVCLIANIVFIFLIYKFTPSYSWIGAVIGYVAAICLGAKKVTPSTIENRIDFIRSYGRFCYPDKIDEITTLVEKYPNYSINEEFSYESSKKEYGTGWMYFYIYFRMPFGIFAAIITTLFSKPEGIFATLTYIELLFVIILFILCIQKRKFAYYAIWTAVIYESLVLILKAISDATDDFIIVLAMGVVAAGIWITLNGIYFKHRKYIFERYETRRHLNKTNVNSEETNNSTDSESYRYNEQAAYERTEEEKIKARSFTKAPDYIEEDYIIPRVDKVRPKEKDLEYYNTEFKKRFGGYVHPYTKKPITTVQDYFDAIDSSDAKRCIVTERTLTLEELQIIVKDKMAGVDAPGIDGDIQNLDDFLIALDTSEE